MLTTSTLIWALAIFLARICDVSLGTIRTVMIVRGRRLLSALIGFVEVAIFIVVITRVIQHIDTWINVVAYAGGFAAGTYVGMTLESYLVPGRILMRVISREAVASISTALRAAGFGLTEISGFGKDGPVVMLESVIRRREMPRFVQLVEEVDERAFITSEDMRSISRGYLLRRDKSK